MEVSWQDFPGPFLRGRTTIKASLRGNIVFCLIFPVGTLPWKCTKLWLIIENICQSSYRNRIWYKRRVLFEKEWVLICIPGSLEALPAHSEPYLICRLEKNRPDSNWCLLHLTVTNTIPGQARQTWSCVLVAWDTRWVEAGVSCLPWPHLYTLI